MKNIILNSVQLASSLKLDASYCAKKQIKKGLLGFIAVILIVISCTEQPKKHISIEDKNPSQVEETESDESQLTGRKITDLSKTSFKMVIDKKDTINIPLSSGASELLTRFPKADDEILQFLGATKSVLSKDTIEKALLDSYLVKFKEIKVKYPKAENFGKFVDALENAPLKRGKVNGTANTAKESRKNVIADKSEDTSLFWIELLLAISITALIILLTTKYKKMIFRLFQKFNKKEEPTQVIEKPTETVSPTAQAEKNVANTEGANQETLNDMVRKQQQKEAQLKKQLEASENKQAELEAENKQLREQNENKNMGETPENKVKTDILPTISEKNLVETPEIVAPPPVEIAYLSLPMNELIFNNASKSLVAMVGQSFYEFTIHADGTTATFKFWDNPDAVKYAIDKPHSHIEPACDSLNVHDSYATKITTVEVGRAELQDNKWIVKSKAKIRYEL